MERSPSPVRHGAGGWAAGAVSARVPPPAWADRLRGIVQVALDSPWRVDRVRGPGTSSRRSRSSSRGFPTSRPRLPASSGRLPSSSRSPGTSSRRPPRSSRKSPRTAARPSGARAGHAHGRSRARTRRGPSRGGEMPDGRGPDRRRGLPAAVSRYNSSAAGTAGAGEATAPTSHRTRLSPRRCVTAGGRGTRIVKIAILGWGSLLWDERPEFEEQLDGCCWNFDGPELELEFSRISESRCDALTLVVDRERGAPTTVAWRLSKRASVEEVVCDLRCREGTSRKNIGLVDFNAGRFDCPVVREWASPKGLVAVVWTALKPGFEDVCRDELVEKAVKHVRSLAPPGQAKAAEYVWRAPEFVDTPVRRALQQEPWFHALKPSGG